MDIESQRRGREEKWMMIEQESLERYIMKIGEKKEDVKRYIKRGIEER